MMGAHAFDHKSGLSRMSHAVPIVFVVDDDVSVRESLAFVDPLRRLGATDICVRTRIPLPGLNGLELQKQVAVERPDQPIMHAADPKDCSRNLSPMGMISDVGDIVEAIVYLTDARHVTGEVLHVDAGAHNGKW